MLTMDFPFAEVPVRVVQSTADASHIYQTSERVVLSCELSCPDVAVCWYKDGKEVVENTGFLLENEGSHHRLVIPAAQKHDTGQYMCDAAGNSIFFNVTITGEEFSGNLPCYIYFVFK